MSDGPDLLVLGDVNPDLILAGDVVPRFGQAEQVLDRAVLTVGGSGAITACGAARLGLSVAICGVVGDDVFGRFMRERLTERGVDVRGLLVDPAAPTGVTVVLAREGDRASLTMPGTIAALTAARIDPDLLDGARHVHVSQYFMQDGLRPDLPAVFGRVRARGATTSIDPNADPAGTWDAGLRDLLPMVNVFLPNAAEVRAIAGVDDVRAAAAALAVGGTTVVVKDADAGALVATADGIVEGSAFAVDAVDATGAGDSFDAGFLTATMDGRSVRDALRWANACGALSTRAYGGTDAQPTRSEIEGLLG